MWSQQAKALWDAAQEARRNPHNDQNLVQALTPPNEWENRYNSLVAALLEACEEADRSYTNNAVDTDYVRKIIKENT